MTPVFSIIQKSQLEGAKRLDAEYYQPEYFIDFSKGSWVPIGDILDICQYGLSLAMNDDRKGYPMFKMDDICDEFLFDDEVRYADASQELFDVFHTEKNDIFFNRVNSEEFVGRTGILKVARDAVFASYLIRIRPKADSGVLPDYLNIFLNSSYGNRQIRKCARRSVNQANVNAEELKQFRIFLFPLQNQKEIADLSNQSWAHYEIAKSLYSQAEQILLKELGLEDFEEDDELWNIVHLSDIKAAHRMDAEYFQPKYAKLFRQLEKHSARLLGELVTIKKGIEPGSEAYTDEGKLFIRVSNISRFGLADKDQKYLSDRLYKELKDDYAPKTGEILLTKDASPGIACVLTEKVEGVVSGGVLRLKLKESMDAEYLAFCINSLVGRLQAERDAGGSIIAHWKPEQIKQVLIPILPTITQQHIAELVRASHAARAKARELLEEAKRTVEDWIESRQKNGGHS